MRVGEGAELVAVQQLGRRAGALQQHDLHAALRHQRPQLREHRPVGRHAGPGGDQQVACIAVARHQAEAAERAARFHMPTFRQAFEQRGRRATGHVADRDLHRFARAQRMVVDRRQRIAALGRRAVGVAEMHLDELAGDEVQRLPVVADELVVAHAGRQHAAAYELQWEMHDRQGVWNTVWPGAAPAGRL